MYPLGKGEYPGGDFFFWGDFLVDFLGWLPDFWEMIQVDVGSWGFFW